MAITKNSGRQKIQSARVDFTYADLGAAVTAGTLLEAFDMPPNAVVVGGSLVVTTAWVGPTAATLSLGDGGSATRHANAVNLLAAARTALTITGYTNPEADTLDATLVQTVAAATAGAGYIEVHYTVKDRAEMVYDK